MKTWASPRPGPGQWNLVGVAIDVTALHEAEESERKPGAVEADSDPADCLLWHPSVRREGDRLQWRDFTCRLVLCDRLFGGKAPATGTGLWFDADTPDLAAMNRHSDQAILTGAPGYEQEFPVIRSAKTLWLHEQVSITPVGPDRWDLVGVLMDVTAQHEADEARKRVEAQVGTLLKSANCLLWQAQVTENPAGGTDWNLYIPQSNLYRELFRADPSERGNRMWSKGNLERSELNVPELLEMNELAEAAIRDGLPGYEQEFRARSGRAGTTT